jgi:hypothetical protein
MVVVGVGAEEQGKNQEHGKIMARTWQYHATNMATSWQSQGKSMARTGQ